jgi:hypothetical protein
VLTRDELRATAKKKRTQGENDAFQAGFANENEADGTKTASSASTPGTARMFGLRGFLSLQIALIAAHPACLPDAVACI